MEDDDFLAEIGKDDDAVTTEAPAVEPVAEEASAEPVAEPVVVEPAPEPAKPEPGFVPFAAVLDERDKRKKLEQENEELRKQNQTPVQHQPAPDMFEDPEGYRAHQAGEAHRLALNVKLDLSEDMARGVHGDELVDKARDWAVQKFQQNPGYQAEVFSQRNPYNFVVAQYQRDQIASSVTPDEFAQFTAWKQAQAGLTPAPAAPTDNPSPAKPPPRSLASAPSAGPAATEPVQSDEEIFAETFARK